MPLTTAYAYTPGVVPPLLLALCVAALGLYGWRRRRVPGGVPFVAASLCASLWLVGIAFETAAVDAEAKLAWYRFQYVCLLPSTTAGTCFALDYSSPGRWLTRHNLRLLAIPPLAFLLLVLIEDSRFIWQRLVIGPDGSVIPDYAAPGAILVGYAAGLLVVNAAALVWLFVRSPQHRWPVALLLLGQVGGRVGYLFDAARLPALTPLDPTVAAILAPWLMYAVALFGFRILDALPAAHEKAVEQISAGVVVFDSDWHVVYANPAARALLGARFRPQRGAMWQDLAPARGTLPSLPALSGDQPGLDAEAEALPFVVGDSVRWCVPTLSPLRDPRGFVVGYLLSLRDVTDQRRDQALLVEQQRAVAVLEERQRLALELHDSLGQVLAAAHLQASAARMLLARGETGQVDQCLEQLATMAREAEVDVREYLLGVGPALPTPGGLFQALEDYVQRFSTQYALHVRLTAPAELRARGLPRAAEVQVVRIVQEALSNVRKHATASQALVSFAQTERGVELEITDDGRGFDPAAVGRDGSGFGLRSMRERAEELGGALEVTSGPGRGTRISVRLPVQRDANNDRRPGVSPQ